MWIFAFLIWMHASQITKAQEPWKIKTASIYEIDFYDFKVPNFDTAKKLCEDNAGTMVRLDDEEVRNTVYATIPNATELYFWIGATGVLRNWKWLDETSVNKSILIWGDKQPDNYGNNELRLIIRKKENNYGDIHATFNAAGTICLRDIVLKVSNRKLTIHRYYSNGTTMAVDYETAKSRCASMASRLAVVDGTTQNTLTANLINDEFHWVGTNATGECKAVAKNALTEQNCTLNLPYVCEQAGTNVVATSNLNLTATSAKEINCTANGFPFPSVVWEKDGVAVSVSSTDGLYQNKWPGLARLHLENANLTDEGEYKCVARNTIEEGMCEKTAIAQLKVPSKPTILSIEPQSCNSSFIIKWKPHQRAIGVEHKIGIYQNNETYEQQVNLIPNEGEQFFVSTNLTSFTMYNVVIYTCKFCDTTLYSELDKNYTRGIPMPVQEGTLLKASDGCKVNWTLPKNTPKYLLAEFKVKITFTIVKVAVGTNVSIEEDEAMTNFLSFNIPKRPNRNHTVTITSQTCAGFGEPVVAEGVCVTDVEAPTSILQPTTGTGTNAVSEDGRLSFVMTVPNQANGTISCIFVIVQSGESDMVTRFNETELKNANKTGNWSRYIAVALDQQSFGVMSELNITIGNDSTTRCNIRKQQNTRRKRAASTDEDYVGRNGPLLKDKSYNIYLVTSTPSENEVFFQISQPLGVQATPKEPGGGETGSQPWLIPVIIAAALLVVIALVVVVLLKRRSTKQNPLTSEKGEELEEVNFHRNGIVATDSKRIRPSRNQPSHATTIAFDVKQEQVLYENFKAETKVQMSDFEAYYNHLCREECSLFKSQFKTILEQAVADMQSTSFAANPALKRMNRYKNILPFDSTRVVINGTESGYINACYIKGFDKKRKFIATQGPLQTTVNDFWLMAIENECRIIVMLAKCFEGGKKKCQQYWPEEGKSATYGTVTVHNKAEIKSCGFMLRKFQASCEGGAIELLQFQYLNWPDHGVPKTTSTLVRMHKAVIKSWRDNESSSPMIVHCSAGAGRTGTFIGYDFMLEQSSQEDEVDVFDCVIKMRSQRVDMVQNCDQYILVHKLLLENYLFVDTDLDSHELTQKLQNMNSKDSSQELSKEFKNLLRLATVKSTSSKEQSENPQGVLIILRPSETTPPKLNSAWVESYDENSPMIAAQTPDDASVPIFWRAVSDSRVNTIVMLGGKKENMRYCPTCVGETSSFDDVAVSLLSEDSSSTVVERILQISNGSKQSTVTQYHYPEWDAKNCPDKSHHILELVEKIQRSIRKENGSAVLIHCSDGLGRTGTLCAIVNLIERLKIESRVDVFRAVKDLRDCRLGMVSSLDQYLFCYRVVSDYLKSFDIYSNFG